MGTGRLIRRIPVRRIFTGRHFFSVKLPSWFKIETPVGNYIPY
nr:hypothetical protein [Neobacillus soli]